MVRWAIGSILQGGPIEPFLVLDWCNKRRGMYYPPCEMVHIKETLLLIGKISPWSDGSGFPLLLFEWSITLCPTPYNHIKKCVPSLLHWFGMKLKSSKKVLEIA